VTTRLLIGHVIDRLAELPNDSVHCVVTSPPYYGLRDYGIAPQVWGGAPGCEHAWGGEVSRVKRRRTDNGLANTGNGGPETRLPGLAEAGYLSASQGAFCRRCNAWRGSLGLEPTPALFIEHMVAVFRQVRRLLRTDGTLWLNIGDSYAGSWGNQGRTEERGTQRAINGEILTPVHDGRYPDKQNCTGTIRTPGLKPKDLLGVPWMLAFALRDDGWWLRSEITWAKRAPMPESCTDRPTMATEKVFLLTKSARYFYDQEAVKEEASTQDRGNGQDYGGFVKKDRLRRGVRESTGDTMLSHSATDSQWTPASGRNMRNWWLLGPEPFAQAHFATFPSEIPRRAILAGTSERGVCPKCGAPWERVVVKAPTPGQSWNDHTTDLQKGAGGHRGDKPTGTAAREGYYAKRAAGGDQTIGWRASCSCAAGDPRPATVLDPFFGAGTAGLVADQLRRDCIGIELNPQYAEMAERRIVDDAPLFAAIAADHRQAQAVRVDPLLDFGP
jgi:DNA modification methylase